MWLWDSVFHSLAMNRLDPAVAWQYLKSVLDTQGPDGMIPHQAAASGARSPITQPPLLAWGVWENYQALGERDHLAYALPRLERYLEWDLAQRDRSGNGLLEWLIEETVRCRSGESGMDNSPRFDRFLRLDAVDFCVYAAQDMRCLSYMAAELGQAAQAKAWRARAGELAARVHRDLWDEAQGFYFDRDSRGELSPVRAVSGFLPLLLDGVPRSRVSRLVRALQDPATFNTAFPVPSVAVNDPSWSTDMWRGATWANTNYLVILGLRKHGRREVARWLSHATIAMVAKYYERLGVLFEFYDAKDEVPPPLCDRKGPHRGSYDIRKKMDSIRDYHWTAALTACLLLDEEGRSPRRRS
jgi:glycogen debranching enzyme